MLKNRTLETSKELLNNNLNEIQKQNISFVSMDMWKGYTGTPKQSNSTRQIPFDKVLERISR